MTTLPFITTSFEPVPIAPVTIDAQQTRPSQAATTLI